MTPALHVGLALPSEASEIAGMFRELIEHGLPWSWLPERVSNAIGASNVNVAVVRERQRLLAFGIMEYWEEDAHLVLFAVRPTHHRQGIGTAVLRWLEASAIAAGAKQIRLEVRTDNAPGRTFYNEHGYHELVVKSRMYSSRLDGIQMEKWLRTATSGA